MTEQEKIKIRTICMDGDSIEILFRFDEECQKWLGDYPYFKDEPRNTPFGRPWRNVSYTECPHHSDPEFNDCGSCKHYRKEKPQDIIGVCFCDALRIFPEKRNPNSIQGGTENEKT